MRRKEDQAPDDETKKVATVLKPNVKETEVYTVQLFSLLSNHVIQCFEQNTHQ